MTPNLTRLALHLVGVARLISGYLHRREYVVHTAYSASTADSIGHADASHPPNTLPTASGTEDGPTGSLSLPPAPRPAHTHPNESSYVNTPHTPWSRPTVSISPNPCPTSLVAPGLKMKSVTCGVTLVPGFY